jgi:1-pyrroline-5-carboxylate dehydrogenase
LKPADTQVLNIFYEILQEAGLPDGVINLVYADGPELGDICFVTGILRVFILPDPQRFSIRYGNILVRISGNTGPTPHRRRNRGKDFVLVHREAEVDVAVTALPEVHLNSRVRMFCSFMGLPAIEPGCGN